MRNVNRSLWTLLSIMVLVLGLAMVSEVSAQVISGDLVGIVLDKTGAAVPGASVEAVNVDTGVKYSTKTNELGEYRISNLPVGTYNVSGSATNFATTTLTGFKIELNKTITLQITLEVKGAVTTIEVSGAAPALDTTTAQLSNTFESRQLADLPSASSGSGVLNLSLLGSGVATSGGVGVGSGPSVGGQRPRNNDFMVEGVDNNSKSVTGPLVFVPNDAVSEFSMLQNQFSPEFGHSSGGQFNTIVKSGTNSYHGLAYLYNNNRNYNALDTIQKIEGFTSQPRYDFNRIGGQVGGPILKNKLFFFADYEYQPYGAAGGAGAVCVPDSAGVALINSTPGLSATNVAQFEKYVPVGTLTGVSCKPIKWVNAPANCNISPVPAGCLTTAGLHVVSPSYSNTKILVTSMDYDISTKDQIRGRYIWNSFAGIDTSASLSTFFTSVPNKNYLVTINEYHTFNPNLTNEFRLGFNRNANAYPAGNFSYPGVDSFPNFQFNDMGLQLGPDPNAPQSGIQNTYQATEAITWTKNKHTLKFGAEGRKLIAPQTFTQRSRGDYEYTKSLLFFQDAAPDYLAERSNGNPVFYGDQVAFYWFANDNWRIRQNFTINLGLRYEYTTTPFTSRSQALNAAASVPGLINFIAPQPAPNNWAPRIGFAYSPGTSGRTSIRAGVGEAYDVLFDNIGLLALPPELSSTIDCAPVGNYNCATPFLGNGGILPGPGGVRVFPTVAAQRAATSAYLPAQLLDPKSIDWTLGVQHTFGKDYTLEVRYVGTRGIHLPTQIQLNKQPVVTSSFYLPTYTTAPSQATLDALTTTLGAINSAYSAGGNIVPAFFAAGFNKSSITSYQPWSSSTYHGLATQLNKRLSNGLQFVGAYTFSHLIDDATAEVFSTVLSPRRAQNGLNLRNDFANSILDHRHRITLSVIYDVPYFQHSNAFVKNTIGNWEFAPIYTYQSGQWMTAQSGVDSNRNGDSAGDRTILNPSGVPGTGSGVNPLCTSALPSFATCGENDYNPKNGPPGLKNFDSTPYVVAYGALNPNARYIQAAVGALANVGRNTLQLPPINDIDVTALKRFTITERFKIEFQAQAFNVLNHPQWVGGYLNDIAPVGYTGAQVNVLRPQSVDFNRPATQFASNARSMQLALKIFF